MLWRRREVEHRDRVVSESDMRRGGSAEARRHRCARVHLEVIESRLLLSTDLNPGTTAVMIPIPAFAMPALAWNSSGSSTSGSGNFASTFPIPPAHVGLDTGLGTMDGAIAAQIAGFQGGSTSAPNWMTVVSTRTGSLGEDGVSPVVMGPDASTGVPASVWTSPSPANGGGGWGTASAGGWWDRPSGPSAGGLSLAPSMEPAGSMGSLPSGPIGSAMTGLPDMPHVIVEASTASVPNDWNMQIPIDPMTHEVGVTLRSPDSGLSNLPSIVSMVLLDHSGDVLAQFDPSANGPPSGPKDGVTLSFQDLSAGGELVVQLAFPPAPAVGSSILSATRTVPLASSGTFVVDVQRIESAIPSSAAGTDVVTGSSTLGAGSLIGTLASGSDTSVPAWSSSGSFSSDPTSPEASFVFDAGSVAQAVETMAEEGLSDEPPARIAVGPLASRAAAPIGPSLSSLVVDPAPAIDRHERALADAIAMTGRNSRADDRSPSTLPKEEGIGAIQGDIVDGTDPELDSVVGLGPLRLMASRTRGIDRQGSLDALYAAMGPAGATGIIRAAKNGDPTDDEPVLVAFASPSSFDTDRRPTPDYLTSACFVALGMGLMARPILPDLIRLLPARGSRWGRRWIAPACSASAAAEPPHRRSFETWLRRRLDVLTPSLLTESLSRRDVSPPPKKWPLRPVAR